MRGAEVERRVIEAGEHRDQALDRIVGEMRIGDMALHADDVEPAVEAAAPSDLDGLAEPRGVGRLAHERNGRAARLVPRIQSSTLRVPLIAGAFLVAGDEQADRAFEFRALARHIIERRGGESGDRPLHVGGAPPIEHAVLDLGAEGRMASTASHRPGAPRRVWPAKQRCGGPAPMRGIEIVDLLRIILGEDEPLAAKAGWCQRPRKQIQRAGLDRRDARAADQRLCQLNRSPVGRGH